VFSALFPNAVEVPLQSLGHCALSGGDSASQQNAIASVKKPQRNGERLMDLISVFIFLCSFRLNLPCLRRELPSSSREAKNHPKKFDPQERFLIHLAESRLQLFAIARSAGLGFSQTYSVCRKIRWRVAGRDQDLAYQIALQGVKHNYFSNFERSVLMCSMAFRRR
jgi:hypothetical protein